jgi:hypothetical protein
MAVIGVRWRLAGLRPRARLPHGHVAVRGLGLPKLERDRLGVAHDEIAELDLVEIPDLISTASLRVMTTSRMSIFSS